MSKNHNILLLCGGGGSEHEVSLESAKYYRASLSDFFQVELVIINKDHSWQFEDGTNCFLENSRHLKSANSQTLIHAACPCLHGWPGETGDIQSFFELIDLPYFGPGPEANILCFNKVSTKLWLQAFGLPVVPWLPLTEHGPKSLKLCKDKLAQWGEGFLKASSQGSSVGCYPIKSANDLSSSLDGAFNLSPYVLFEKMVKGRELEVSVYEFAGKVHCSSPGEIIAPDGFYSYEEKYSANSKTQTLTKAQGLTPAQIQAIQDYAKQAFTLFKLRHLSRIDFFLEGNDIYINEINTLPGATGISMFPKMLEANGHQFKTYLYETFCSLIKD